MKTRHEQTFSPVHGQNQSLSRTLSLAISALGVVYGDIGTSPLYAIRECFHGIHAIIITQDNIYGVMSLVFWSLTIVVSIKYVIFILSADNHGEGGIFALLGLISRRRSKISPRLRRMTTVAGILGAGLLYGDGIITPAISVLSAVEGLEVATKAAQPIILPLSSFILFFLFIFQARGSGSIGKVFGPLMMFWFGAIAVLGMVQIAKEPHILWAINPLYAYQFFTANHLHAFVVFGSVVLCVTGSEALYADLGHFGRQAIRLSWNAIVYPALLANYFGQGALLITKPEMAVNPFYGLVPVFLLYPMVALATAATVIASQALISGVFSLTQQAIEMNFCPRLQILHTSYEMRGQIYLPTINYALMIACLIVVLGFGNSSRLAGAYGIAVTGTMTITSFLFFLLIHRGWGWSLWKALPIIALFFVFDFSYFGANLLKVLDGGWFTLGTAVILTIAMTTWRRGREEVLHKIGARISFPVFLEDLKKHSIPRVPGIAVFMTHVPERTPPVLLHHLKHNKVLHEKVIILSIISADVPKVAAAERVKVEDLGEGFFRVIATNGFMQKPDVPEILNIATKSGLPFSESETTYFLGRVTILTSGKSRMSKWRKILFAFMAKNAASPAIYFGLPVNRVVELGTQITI